MGTKFKKLTPVEATANVEEAKITSVTWPAKKEPDMFDEWTGDVPVTVVPTNEYKAMQAEIRSLRRGLGKFKGAFSDSTIPGGDYATHLLKNATKAAKKHRDMWKKKQNA